VITQLQLINIIFIIKIKNGSTVCPMRADTAGILYCTESDDTRCCDNTICPPEDGHVDAQNMSRIVM
jgi:hypothetical protein